MLFTSPFFLFFFLPLLLGLYALSPARVRNLLLLLASLFFYAWGEAAYVAVMMLSIGLNFGFGVVLDRAQGDAAAR